MAGGEIRKIQISEGVTLTAPTDLTIPGVTGGGNGVNWYSPAGTGAASAEEFQDKVFLFSDGGTEKVVAFLKVPQDYVAGSQISCHIGVYSPSTSNTIKLRSTAYLIQKNSSAMGASTPNRTSTNLALTNTVANQYREVVLDLTSSIGEIDTVAVAAGDAIRVEIDRDSAADTDTADIRLVPNLSETKFYT